ncbi:MAG: hypothetical protein FJ100_21225 [Deltaproteobacteria bacterium]|nr:hypothetical protein [Deltaproteobacteria bacterium]
MTERTLTITLGSDWQAGLRRAAVLAERDGYQGEVLNFESAGAFFGRLTHNRWTLLRTLQGSGELSIRELARRVGRDIKRVHGDVAALLELGLCERGRLGGVVCPFATVRIDMELHGDRRLAA